MVVDALDLCYTKGHVDTFVILSGDSDFSPLVSKLRENDKTVIGVGVKNSTSDLFINNCDTFIYYDDLVQVAPSRGRARPRASAATPASSASPASATGGSKAAAAAPVDAKAALLEKTFDQVVETVEDLAEERDEDDVIWGSMIKQAIKRRNPGFNERACGFRSFNDLLIEAKKRGLIDMEADAKSGGYVVRPIP
jgi:hypothetical protein